MDPKNSEQQPKPEKPRPFYRRPGCLIAFGVAITVCAGIFGLPLLAYKRLDAGLREQMSKGWEQLPNEERLAREAGLPLTADELRLRIRLIPTAQNAGPFYTDLAKDRKFGDSSFELRDVISGKRRGEVIAKLLPSESWYASAERATALNGAFFNRPWEDGVFVLMPEYSAMKGVAQRFAARAVVRADEGDWNGVRADLARVRRVAEHLLADPSILAFNSAMSCEAYGLNAAKTILRLNKLDAGAKAAVVASYKEPIPADRRFAIEGDLVMQLETSRNLPRLHREWEIEGSFVQVSEDERVRKAAQAMTIRYWRKLYEIVASARDAASLNGEVRDLNQSESPAVQIDALESLFEPVEINFLLAPYEREARRRMILLLAGSKDQGLVDPFTNKPFPRKGDKIWSAGDDFVDDGGDPRYDVVVDLAKEP